MKCVMKTLLAFATLVAVMLVVLLAPVGCSKYEFNDPTGATARVVYDHTGTAAQVEQQQQQQQQRQKTAEASAQKAR